MLLTGGGVAIDNIDDDELNSLNLDDALGDLIKGKPKEEEKNQGNANISGQDL
jgi:hypothetical protein